MSRITTARGAAVIAAVAVISSRAQRLHRFRRTAESGGAADTSKLVIGLESDMAALGYDPVRYSTGQRMFFEGIYDSLFVLDQDGQVVPQLVTTFEYNEDKTQLTLDLDTSATFDDGSTLTADLVKQNLDARGDRRPLRLQRLRRRRPERDQGCVRGRRRHRHPHVRQAQARVRSEPRHARRGDRRARRAPPTVPTLDSTPDGSGPLTIDADATVKGNSYLLVKKEDNPAAADYPFDSYEFKPILDPQARVNAAISGEVDLANITADTQEQVESAGTGLVANGGTVQNIIAFDKTGATRAAVGATRASTRHCRWRSTVRPTSTRSTRVRSRRPTRCPPTTRATCPSWRRSTRTTPTAPRSCSPRPATPTASPSTSPSTRAASATSRRCSRTGRRSAST